MNATIPPFLAAQVDRCYRKRLFRHPDRPGQLFWYSLHPMGQDALNLQSNDYLCLTGHPTIREAAINALSATPGTVLMSQLFAIGQGDASDQRRIEDRLGDFIGLGSGVLFQSGYDANVGLLQAVAQRGMPVYIDQHAHASLYQGIHAAQAAVIRTRHNDVADLRDKLLAGGPGVIAVDAVYSVGGSRAPLREIADLAEEFGCLLVVDESHSLGTHGPQGRGLVRELGLTGRVHFITVSLAKAFATRAGFVACAGELREFLRFTAYPSIFSTALLPHELPPLHATLDVVIQDEARRTALWRNTREARTAVEAAGFQVGNGTEQIIGIRCGPVRSAVVLRDALESRGVFGSLFWYPATDWRHSVLRISINASLTSADIARMGQALREAAEQLDETVPSLARNRPRASPADSLLSSIG